MTKFTVRVGEEFDVREADGHVCHAVTVQISLDPVKPAPKNPLLMAAVFAAILVFSSGTLAVTYGYVTGDFSVLQSVIEVTQKAGVEILQSLTKK